MLSLIIGLFVIGIVITVINWLIPIDPFIMKCIYVLIVLCILFYVLSAFGIGHDIHDSPLR